MSWSIVVKAVWPQCVVLHTRHISCLLQEESRDFSIYVEFRRVIMKLGVVDLPNVLTTSQRSCALLGPFIMAFSKSGPLIRSSHWPALPKTTSVHLSSASTNPLKSHLKSHLSDRERSEDSGGAILGCPGAY